MLSLSVHPTEELYCMAAAKAIESGLIYMEGQRYETDCEVRSPDGYGNWHRRTMQTIHLKARGCHFHRQTPLPAKCATEKTQTLEKQSSWFETWKKGINHPYFQAREKY